MKRLLLEKPFMVLLIYLVAGLALGLVDPNAGRWIQQFGVKPGLATALSVNVIMPLLAVLFGVALRQVGLAILGAVAMTWGFMFGLMLRYTPDNGWNVGELLRSVPPLLIVACLGYAVLGAVTAKASQIFRKSE
jgi:hypothetical protein